MLPVRQARGEYGSVQGDGDRDCEEVYWRGAVYHDSGNLNYAISLRKGHRLVPDGNLQSVFQRLSEGAVEGLRELGLKAEFQPVNDIQVDGKKVSGAAGSIRWNAVFHHGCILVNSDLNILGKVLNVPRAKLEDKHVASVQKRVTTVRDELGRDISTREVRDAIVGGIESCYGVRMESGVLMKEEVWLAEELYQTKYSLLEWNLEP